MTGWMPMQPAATCRRKQHNVLNSYNWWSRSQKEDPEDILAVADGVARLHDVLSEGPRRCIDVDPMITLVRD